MESFESPESSAIERATYDPDTLQMIVHLRQGKARVVPYAYEGIEPELWQRFQEAVSKGAFFGAEIRPLVVGRKQA